MLALSTATAGERGLETVLRPVQVGMTIEFGESTGLALESATLRPLQLLDVEPSTFMRRTSECGLSLTLPQMRFNLITRRTSVRVALEGPVEVALEVQNAAKMTRITRSGFQVLLTPGAAGRAPVGGDGGGGVCLEETVVAPGFARLRVMMRGTPEGT